MKQIVLIEDNPSDRLIIKLALEEQGINAAFHELSDGEQALHFVRKACHTPPEPVIELILLDLNLPRYSGHELLAQVRTCFPDVPILVISSADPGREQPKLAPYTPHYFRKPHGLEEFLQIGQTIAFLLNGKTPASQFREVSGAA